MKRIILLSFTIVLSVNLYSQSFNIENLRAGAGLFYATEIKNAGLSISGIYSFTDPWEASINYTHIFEKDYVKWNVLDFNGQYGFYKHDEKLSVFGLAGLSFNFWKVTIPAMDLGWGITSPETIENGTEVGLNLGVGANYSLSETLILVPEVRLTLMDGSYFRFGLSAQYLF